MTLLALSGPCNLYPGKLGVVQPGALADLLRVDGDAQKNLLMVMKDEQIVKQASTVTAAPA